MTTLFTNELDAEKLEHLLGADPATLTDEERLLRALRMPGVHGTEAEIRKAPFKIEVHWGSDRTMYGQNTGALLCWESGRRLDGQADSLLFWCGYPDCRKPVRAGSVQAIRVACASCGRDSVTSPDEREACANAVGLPAEKAREIRSLPIAGTHWFFKMSMKNVANLMADFWHRLGGQADVCMKYSRHDARVEGSDRENVAAIVRAKEKADVARYREDGILVYPLHRIQRDIAAGSSVESRFLAMCRA